jgi:hypothetical protein
VFKFFREFNRVIFSNSKSSIYLDLWLESSRHASILAPFNVQKTRGPANPNTSVNSRFRQARALAAAERPIMFPSHFHGG